VRQPRLHEAEAGKRPLAAPSQQQRGRHAREDRSHAARLGAPKQVSRERQFECEGRD